MAAPGPLAAGRVAPNCERDTARATLWGQNFVGRSNSHSDWTYSANRRAPKNQLGHVLPF